jgi:hypothetical protein
MRVGKSSAPKKAKQSFFNLRDGEGGIRTLVKVTPKQHFQCCAFNHSATSPWGCDRSTQVRYLNRVGGKEETGSEIFTPLIFGCLHPEYVSLSLF